MYNNQACLRSITDPLNGYATKISIFVEDRLSKSIVTKALRCLGEPIHKKFLIQHPPGGATVLLQHYLPAFARTLRNDTIYILDGDQTLGIKLTQIENIDRLDDKALDGLLEKVLRGTPNLPVDGGADGGNETQQRMAKIAVLNYAKKYLMYLPGDSPESFIWQNMTNNAKAHKFDFSSEKDYKKRFEKLTRLELGKESYETVTSEEIFQCQQRCLTTVPIDKLTELTANIKRLYISFRN